MFANKENKKELEQLVNASNNIGLGTTIKGDITTKGNIRIEGEIIGNVETSAKLSLGEGASIIGNIIAANAEIAGNVSGNVIITELLSLKPTSTILGDIETGKLAVEIGAIFNGKCKMKNQDQNSNTK